VAINGASTENQPPVCEEWCGGLLCALVPTVAQCDTSLCNPQKNEGKMCELICGWEESTLVIGDCRRLLETAEDHWRPLMFAVGRWKDGKQQGRKHWHHPVMDLQSIVCEAPVCCQVRTPAAYPPCHACLTLLVLDCRGPQIVSPESNLVFKSSLIGKSQRFLDKAERYSHFPWEGVKQKIRERYVANCESSETFGLDCYHNGYFYQSYLHPRSSSVVIWRQLEASSQIRALWMAAARNVH
jgi:hypothetical protein